MREDHQFCLIYRLNEDAGEEYDRRHAAVWPSMVDLLQESGVYDYSIFRRGDLVISVYRTTPEHGRFQPSAAAGEIQARWTASLASLFESISEPGGEPLWAHRVFRLPDAPDRPPKSDAVDASVGIEDP